MNSKRILILLIMAIIAVNCVFFSWILISNLNRDIERLVDVKIDSTRAMVTVVDELTSRHYTARVTSLALRFTQFDDGEVIHAFDRQDRNTLLNSTLPIFNLLQKEDPDLSTFAFILPDNTNFLRVHKPKIFGDDISGFRPDIVDANTQLHQHAGYVITARGLRYSIIQPLFLDDKHIGLLQLGLDESFIHKVISENLAIPIAIILPEDKSKLVTDPTVPSFTSGSSTILTYETDIFNANNIEIDCNHAQQRVRVGSKHYVLAKALDLLDYDNQLQGSVIVALDISDTITAQSSAITYIIILSMVLLLVSYLILNVGYGVFSRKIEAATAETEEEKERLEVTLGSIGDGVISTDVAGNIVIINRVAETLTGWKRKDAVGHPIWDVYKVTDKRTGEASKLPIDEVIASGKTIGLANHAVLISRDGSITLIADSAAPILDVDGVIIGAVLAFRDVTEEYRLREELLELATIAEQAEEGIALADLDGTLRYVNLSWARMHGFADGDELKGRNLSIFHTEQQLDAEVIPFNARVKQDGYGRGEVGHVKSDGSTFPTQMSVGLLKNENGDPYGLVGFAQDITERKRAELRIKEDADELAALNEEVTSTNEELSATNEELEAQYEELSATNDDLRTMQASLLESEARYRTLVENAPEAIAVFDLANGSFVDVNENAERLYGLTKEELLKCSPAAVSPPVQPDGRSSIEAAMAYMLEAFKGNVQTFEWMHVNSSTGEEVLCEVRLVRLPSSQRKLVRGSIIDITERKRAEAELNKEKHLLQIAVDSIPGVFYIFPLTEDSRLKRWNKTLETITGYTPEEIGQMQPLEFIEPKNHDLISRSMQDVLQKGSASVDTTFVTKAGKCIPMLMTGRLITIDGVPHDVGVGLDISDLKNTEAQLEKARNYLSNIIDSMPSILVGVDSNCRVTQWNSEAELATGTSADEAIGLPLEQALPQMAAEKERVCEAMETGEVSYDRRQARTVNGKTYYQDVTIYPLSANIVDGAVIRIDDVTEQMRIEEMMIQSEKMMSVGGLAAGMAHEINNPLGGMMQTASVMADRLSNMELPANRRAAAEAGTTIEAIGSFMKARKIIDMLGRIRASGNRAASIVANMLSFSRKGGTTLSSNDVADLLDRTVELAGSDYNLKKNYDFRRIEIIREYENDLPLVPCEAGKIQQVLLNILRNGAESMQESIRGTGELTDGRSPRFVLRLAHEKEAGMIRIEIEDNGPGMPEQVRRRIFEPFFTTKPTDQGTGLGLSVSYFIITENHGGEMTVESREGVSTSFTIRLPIERSVV